MMAGFDYKAFADEARRRTMKDMTGGEYEEHLARVTYDAATRPAPKADSALVGELRRIAGWIDKPTYRDEATADLVAALPRILAALRAQEAHNG